MHPGGRPPKFKSVKEIEDAIAAYYVFIAGEFENVVNKITGSTERVYIRYPEPATITGLALHLGFESRQSFHDYKAKKEFTYTIKKARLRIENEYEKKLSGQQPAGSIFALKNLGWNDKTQHELTGANGAAIKSDTTFRVEMIDTLAGISKTEKEIREALADELGEDIENI